MNPSPADLSGRQRGSVLVGAVMLLLVLAAFTGVCASVLATGQSAFVAGETATQAFYAAESGLEMALMEHESHTDNDADGVVGGISADGDEENDPALGQARMEVSISGSDPVTLTATGRDGDSRRVVEITIR